MISILLPSRGRCGWLERGVNSLRNTASGEVQVIVGVDDDDPMTRNTALDLGCTVVETPRLGYGRLYEYFNLMSDQAVGDWQVLWDDSSVMQTEGWDDMLYALPSNILVGDLQNHFSPHLCCFPAVRSNAVRSMGCFSLDTPHVDTVWEVIGRHLEAISPVAAYVHHDRPDITGVPADLTYVEGRAEHRSSDFHGPEFQRRLRVVADKIGRECLEL